MSSKAKRHVYALFSTRDDALSAYAQVQQQGCQNEHCSVLMQRGLLDPEELTLSETAAREGAKKGAVLVGVIGAVLAGAFAFPHGLLGMGPITAALLAGAWGAGLGALLGSLVGSSEADRAIRTIESEIGAGKTLVAVETNDARLAKMCNDVFASHGGRQIA